MTAFVGRKALFKKGETTVAAVRTRSMTLGNEVVDITSDDDNGFRTMLAEPGTKTLDLTLEGVFKDATMLTVAMSASDILDAFSILFPSIGTIAGDFVVTSFEAGAAYNEAGTFSCSLQSSGTFTFTAAV
jgi:predicted secreted protein